MRRLPLAIALLSLSPLGCQDLREYTGSWEGTVSGDPALSHGFAPTTQVTAEFTAASHEGVAFTLVLKPGIQAAHFVPIKRAAGDLLADVELPGEPLRTFFGFVDPPGGAEPYLTIVSLYPENRVELRLIRGADDAYGVFSLHRAQKAATAAATNARPQNKQP